VWGSRTGGGGGQERAGGAGSREDLRVQKKKKSGETGDRRACAGGHTQTNVGGKEDDRVKIPSEKCPERGNLEKGRRLEVL